MSQMTPILPLDKMPKPIKVIEIYDIGNGSYTAKSQIENVQQVTTILFAIIKSYIRKDERRKVLAATGSRIVDPVTGEPVIIPDQNGGQENRN